MDSLVRQLCKWTGARLVHAHVVLSFALCFGLLGCAVHQIERQPDPRVTAPEQFTGAGENAGLLPRSSVWWAYFERDGLDAMIRRALENNQDLAQSVARFRQARAFARQTNALRLPEVSLDGEVDKSWQGFDAQPRQDEIGASLIWEIDLFNRIGYATTADRLTAEARAEDVADLQLLISADVANAYFGSVAAHLTLQLIRQQIELDRDLLELLQLRFDNGVGTNVDVLQQASQLTDSESLIPLATADLQVFENRLDVLLGVAPDGRDRVGDSDDLAFLETMPPIGVPSDLLLQRPDLRAARADLVAADASIGVAIADRLPRVTLDGSLSYGDAANFSGALADVGAGLVMPLLDWGRRKAEVERNRALYEERLAAFTQRYLLAVEEVENALVLERQQREFIRRLERLRAILEETVEETDARFRQGIDDYLPVISALQRLREVERSLIIERLELILFRVNLHRAIGGSVTTENLTE